MVVTVSIFQLNKIITVYLPSDFFRLNEVHRRSGHRNDLTRCHKGTVDRSIPIRIHIQQMIRSGNSRITRQIEIRRFAEIIWDREPVGSTELVRLAEEALGWKKSTTYTVLKRLCDRGIFQNEGGTVTSRLSRADYDTAQSQQFVEESFSGSLPAFITAFTRRKKLTEDEIAELQKLIDQNRR